MRDRSAAHRFSGKGKHVSKFFKVMAAGMVISAAVSGAASAAPCVAPFQMEMYSDSVSFTSDAENSKTINLPSFDEMGGLRTLCGVQVDIWSDASVDIRGDNDDPFKPATVQARMIRNYNVNGPGVAAFSFNTTPGGMIQLAPDNGDGAAFDPTAPDGFDFVNLAYSNLAALGSPFNPAVGLYATPGPGNVAFTVPGPNGSPGSALLMVNDLQFFGIPPDQWQLEVQNPILTVHVKVKYTYVPEPASLSFLGLGALALLRRRFVA